jgi:hypothetical protein
MRRSHTRVTDKSKLSKEVKYPYGDARGPSQLGRNGKGVIVSRDTRDVSGPTAPPYPVEGKPISSAIFCKITIFDWRDLFKLHSQIDSYGAVHIEATCYVQAPNWQVITLVTICSKI